MHRSLSLVLAALVFLVSMNGCARRNTEVKTYQKNHDYYNYEDYYMDFSGLIINCMEPLPGGSIACIANKDDSLQYMICSKDGSKSIDIKSSYDAICYDAEEHYYYAHNVLSHEIEIRNDNFETIGLLADGFKAFQVMEMIEYGDDLYVLCLPENEVGYSEDGHVGNEKNHIKATKTLFMINLPTGEFQSVSENEIISICRTDDNFLYLYSYRDDEYYIEKYDVKKEALVSSQEINNVSDVSSFAVFGDKMFFVGEGYSGICCVDLGDFDISSVYPDVITYNQSDFEIVDDILIFLNRKDMCVYSLNISDNTISGNDQNSLDKTKDRTLLIAVETPSIEIESVKNSSDLSVKFVTPDPDRYVSSNERIVNDLLSDEPNYDIYIVDMGYTYCSELGKEGYFYPLESSGIISDENDKYFDFISEYLHSDSGSIWGIPLRINAMVLMGVPEKMKEEGIAVEDISDFSGLYDTLERINNVDENSCFIDGGSYGAYVLLNYISNNASVDFMDESFKSYFEKMWNGWIQYDDSGKANHPIMGTISDDLSLYEHTLLVAPDKTLFNIVMEEDIIENKKLQKNTAAYKLPVISREYKNDIFISQVAIINPKSEKRKEALEFLEEMTQYLHATGKLGIVYKDKSDYASVYDTESDIFDQMYEINSESIVMKNGPGFDIYLSVIPAYQHGEITLDGALESAQRRADLNR